MHTYRVLDVPLLRVVRDELVELALEVLLLLLVQLVLFEQPAFTPRASERKTSIRFRPDDGRRSRNARAQTHLLADPDLILSCLRSVAASLMVVIESKL